MLLWTLLMATANAVLCAWENPRLVCGNTRLRSCLRLQCGDVLIVKKIS